MNNTIEIITKINNAISDFMWVKIGLILLMGTGITMTIATKCFQLTHIGLWLKSTIGSMFTSKNKTKKKDSKSISQFQALCTALAGTIGTGSIAGVAAAIFYGGAGAVLWMWVAAFFGMMTKFAEIILGIYFRRKNENGEWSGGAMYYLSDGLGRNKKLKVFGKVLAVLFSVFTIIASFGIGNLSQVNKISTNIQSAFFENIDLGNIVGVPTLSIILGLIITVISAIIILGGLKRISAFAEKVVPFMAALYIVGTIVILFMNIRNIGPSFLSIFKNAFGTKALQGGIIGIAVKEVIVQGCKKGIFSNEAGLGSSVMVHSSARVREPVQQGMWGIFEVFFVTFVICTMTSLVILTSGFVDLNTGIVVSGMNDATLVARIFEKNFGNFGDIFIAIAILLFAFTTILGWSQYGAKAIEYLLGIKAVKPYKILFVCTSVFGAVISSSIAWEISDTFNAFMMLPNLIGLILLVPLIIKITKNFIDRKIKKIDTIPMLSYDENIQNEFIEEMKQEEN